MRQILTNSFIIIIVLLVAFLSQMMWGAVTASTPFSNGIKSENAYASKAQDWLKNNVYDKLSGPAGKVSGEVAKTQDSVQQKITDEKNNLIEKSTDAAKKFLAEKILNILGVTPQELGACPANPTN